MFQRKLYNNYVFCVVYCLLCCALYHSIVLCQQSNANFFNKIYLFFIKTNLFCVNFLLFFECCRFLNVCMQCLVDVTESLVEPLRVWCRYAFIPLAGLSRRSASRWHPWAYHATNHNNFIYQPIFTIFAAKKFSNKQAIIILKKINIMFNKTIWILTFFSQ